MNVLPTTDSNPTVTIQQPPPVAAKFDKETWKTVFYMLFLFAGVAVVIVFVLFPFINSLFTSRDTTKSGQVLQPPTTLFDEDFWKQEGNYYVDDAGTVFSGKITMIYTNGGGWDYLSWPTLCCDLMTNEALAFGIQFRGVNGFCNNKCLIDRGIACLLTKNYMFWLILTNYGQRNISLGEIPNNPTHVSTTFVPQFDYSIHLNLLIKTFPPLPDLSLITPGLLSCSNIIYAVANGTVKVIV